MRTFSSLLRIEREKSYMVHVEIQKVQTCINIAKQQEKKDNSTTYKLFRQGESITFS